MRKTQKFMIEGFKAKAFNFVESEDGQCQSYTLKIKIPQNIKTLDMSANRFSRFHTKKMASFYDFYTEHLEQRCSHEWDCCGCWFTSVGDITRKGKWVYFKMGLARNV